MTAQTATSKNKANRLGGGGGSISQEGWGKEVGGFKGMGGSGEVGGWGLGIPLIEL